jgi:hypothetical protein
VVYGVLCIVWGHSKAPLVFKFVEASLTMATVPLAQGSKVHIHIHIDIRTMALENSQIRAGSPINRCQVTVLSVSRVDDDT